MSQSHLSIHIHEPPKHSPFVAAERVLADLEAVMRIVRHLFCARLDWEEGLTFEELYDLDCTLELAFEAARNRIDRLYGEARAESGEPPLEEKLPGLKKPEDTDGD